MIVMYQTTVINILFNVFSKTLRLIFIMIYGVKGKSMPPITNAILLESATTLARKIREKEITSVQVVTAFINRIKEVNPLLNCCVDERFDEALKEAARADELISTDKLTADYLEKSKPFFGVPLSTKDCIAVKGLLHTAGLYVRRNVRAEDDAKVIALMREAGAIPFCLTNVSEVCMWWESNNCVHGRTNNPYDTNRIVGGSSGGEGCIQAAAASAFGIGSDIGGSIRMPAFFNGVFGHKPTRFVVSNIGQFPMPFTQEQNSFLGIGPIVRHAEDLKPMLKIIAGDKKDLLLLDEPVDLKNVQFYYQENDGGGRLVSSVDTDLCNGLRNVVEYFQSQLNISPKRIKLEKFQQSASIWFANMADDSGFHFENQLANLKGAINPYKELLKWCFGLSRHTLIGLLTCIIDKSVCAHGSSKHQHFVNKRDKLREELSNLLGDNGVFIYPTHPTVAPYHNEPIFRPLNFSYTAIINVLGFPATAIPLGRLGSEGVPLGIQVVANFNQDRLCLAVAEELERAFGGWCRPKVKL